jgi:hypothetical protein
MNVSIEYFKKNLKKFDHDNLIAFLFDIVLRVDINEVVDYDNAVQYHLHEKVYVQDVKGKHHIYKCLVENSTVGELKDEEWIDLIQSFRKPIVSDETVVAGLDIRQEILISTEDNQMEFKLKTAGVGEGMYNIIIFHSEIGRIAKTDFQISGQNIVLNEEYRMKQKGGKLIVDLYGKM